MSDGAQFTHAHMVRFERHLPCLPARAWAFLADPGRLPGWYGDGRIEPRVGGAVSLMGGHIRGVVTQWQPPGRLAYTWNVYNPPGRDLNGRTGSTKCLGKHAALLM